MIHIKLKKTAIACAILAGVSTTHYVFAETTSSAISATQGRTFEVGNEASFKNVLNIAQTGDTIKFTANISITEYTQTAGKSADPLYLDKQVTIDGNGHALSVRAAPLALKADVVLKNIQLQLKPLNSQLAIGTEAEELTSYIYANGHRLELDNVTTKAEGLHDRTRPTIIMGTVDGSVADAGHAELVVKNSQTETHFKQIIANSLNADKSTPTKISLDKDTKLIDNTGLQIDFSAAGHAMTGKVEVVLDGTKVSSLGGNKAAENSVTLKNASLVNPRLVGLKDLTLEKSSIAAGGVNVKGKLDLKDNSTLSIDSYSSDMTTDNTPEADRKKVQAQTVNSKGGTIELRVEDSSVKVSGDMTGDLTLKIAPAANLSGDIVTVEGNNSATITSGNAVYKVEKNGDNKWTVSKNPPAGSNEDEEDIDDEDEDWTVTPDPNATPSEEKPTEQPTNPEETSESNTSDQGTATEPNSNSGEEATKPSTPEEKPSENTAGEQTGSEQPQTDNPNESGNNAEESTNNPTTPEQPPAEKPTDDNASSGDQNGEQANGSNETNGETSTPGNGSDTSQPNTNGEENKPDAGNDAGNTVTPPATGEEETKPTDPTETTPPNETSDGSSENTAQPPVTDPTGEKPTDEQGSGSANTETPSTNEGNDATPPATNEENSKPTEDNSSSSGETAQPGDNSAGSNENTEQPPVTPPTDEKPAGEQGSNSANTENPSTNEGNDATPPATNEENSKPTEPTTEDNSSSSGETAGNETAQPGDNSASSNENTTQPPVTDPTDEKPAGEQDSGSANTETPSANEGNDATPPTTNEENGKPTAPTEDNSASNGETAGNETTSPGDNSAGSNENTPQPPVTPPTDEKPTDEQGSSSANTENPPVNEGNNVIPPTSEDDNKPTAPTEDNSASSSETAGNEVTQPSDNSAGSNENTPQPPVTPPTDEKPTDEQGSSSANTENPPVNEGNNVIPPTSEDDNKPTAPMEDNSASSGETAGNEATQPGDNSASSNENTEQPPVTVPTENSDNASEESAGTHQPTPDNSANDEVLLLNQRSQKAALLLDMSHSATLASASQNANALIERSYDRNEGEENLWVKNSIAKEKNGFSDEKYKDISRHLMIGVDKCSAYLCAGVAFSANNSDLSSDNLSLQQKMYYAFGYGNYALSDNTKVDFYLGGGVGKVKDRNAHRAYRAKSLQNGVGIGYSFVAESYRVTPFVRADYVATHYATYQTEAFSVASHTAKSLVAKAGVHVDKQVNQNLSLFAKAETGVETLKNGSASVSVGNQNQTLNLPTHSRHSASMGAGVSYSFTPNMKISAAYNYERRRGYNNQVADLLLQYQF